MRIKSLFIFLVSLLFLGVLPRTVAAHKVNLFCYFEDGALKGEGYYSGGRASQNAEIEIYRLSDNFLLAETATDEQGRFAVPLKAVSVKVVMNSGQGHKTEFVLEEEADESVESIKEEKKEKTAAGKVSPAIGQRIMALEQRVRELERRQAEPGWLSIIGGIVLIFGLFALIHFIKKK